MPISIPSRPERLYGDGPYPMGRCYQGVEEYQRRYGGTFQHGWMIWETEGIYLRAFHHSVHWDGARFTDLSFQGLFREITFLPTVDPGITDEVLARSLEAGRGGVPCQYFPLSESALARRIISLHVDKDKLPKFSTQWDAMLDEICDIEVSYHEWEQKRQAVKRRRKQTRRPAFGSANSSLRLAGSTATRPK
jgi:hypothetical protein